jgi:integrase/recombinase XerC
VTTPHLAGHPAASRQAIVEAARLMLAQMGLSPGDLVAGPQDRPPVPTFAEYVPVVSAAVTAGTRRAYGSYWNRVLEHWGERRLDEIAPSEIRQLMSYVKTHVVARRNARGGRSATEHLVAALRCLYRHAEDDGLITAGENPARKVDKPRRLPSTRRAVTDDRLAEICQAAADGGDDPELDTLLLRLHTETACRRGGALALRPDDLDQVQCLIRLREKGETVRWQPVSPTLMARLVEHGQDRHAPPGGQLLRYRNGRPVTARRYDGLWARIGRALPWVRTQQVSMHWIRHTTLTWVERNFGYAVARAYAGHTDRGSDAGATTTYVRATVSEVATALAALAGEPHPLAMPGGLVRVTAHVADAWRAGAGRVDRIAAAPGDPYRGPVLRGPAPCRDRAVLAASGPGRPGRGRGVLRVGRSRTEDRVRAGPAARHLALTPPGHQDHPAGRRGGLRRVRATRLAGPRPGGQRPDAPVRQMVRDLRLRARDGRSDRLPPARPGRSGTGAMARHHRRVVPAGPGPGHGDRAGPHAARRRRRRRGNATRRAGRTSPPAAPSLRRRGPGRTGPGPVRRPGDSALVRSATQDQAGPGAGPRRRPDQHAASRRDRPGTPGRQQARRFGQSGIPARPAQRGHKGFQPSPDRPGTPAQRRALR